ncbi:glycosyltransferase [Paraflavisolibacter sp. H34]|uniref:glycosyltransferase n=1 Tax=Huijunlia imazamoxiresistens TaxID=3127457 RepID=UPI0030171664
MSFYPKNILLISPEPWSHIFVSKHHYAIELSKKGHVVYFLNPPGAASGLKVQPAPGYKHIFTVDYQPLVKGQRFFPAFLSRKVDALLIDRLQKAAGVTFDIVWNFENSRFFDFNFLPRNVLKIYHQVDLNQNFNLKAAASSADICFCTTDLIRNNLLPYNRNAFKIHHGVTENAFSAEPPAPGRAKNGTVNALYVGNLDMMFLDLDLLEAVVKKFPQVTFTFVGPYQKEKAFYRRISNYPHCRLEGKVDSRRIKDYMAETDVLMVLYQQAHHQDQASPHKVVEYLASGKTIVSTYMDEYKDKRELLAMSDENADYVALFEKVISNLGDYNNEAERQKRIAFARNHTYGNQLFRIIELVKDVCDKPLG